MLSGRTVLIVESQFLIALDLQDSLERLQPAKTVIAHNAAHAEELRDEWSDCSLAIVEVERERPDQVALVGELVRRNVLIVGITADSDLPRTLNWLQGTPILSKPVQAEDLESAIRLVLERTP
jgi:DNA-binding NtrC family response regulator